MRALPPSPSRTKIVGDGVLDVPHGNCRGRRPLRPFRAVLVLLCRGGRPCPPFPRHSEPVRTPAWESVSPKKKNGLPRRYAPRNDSTALPRCRDVGTPSPTRGSTYRPVGRGPRAPPKNAYPAAGHMGPALQVHTPPKKTTRRPLRGAAPACQRTPAFATVSGEIFTFWIGVQNSAGNYCDFDGGICGMGTDCHGAARC